MNKHLQETAVASYGSYVNAIGGLLKTLSWPEFISEYRYAIPDEYRDEFCRCTEFDFIDLSHAAGLPIENLVVGREGAVPIFIGNYTEIAMPMLMGNGYPKPTRVMFEPYLPKSHASRASGVDLILSQATRVEAIAGWFSEASELAKRIPGYPSAYQKSLFPELKSIWNLCLNHSGLGLAGSLAVLPESKHSYRVRALHSRDLWISLGVKGPLELYADLRFRTLNDEPATLSSETIRFDSGGQLQIGPLQKMSRWINTFHKLIEQDPRTIDNARRALVSAGDAFDRDMSYVQREIAVLDARLMQLYWFVKVELDILQTPELMHP